MRTRFTLAAALLSASLLLPVFSFAEGESSSSSSMSSSTASVESSSAATAGFGTLTIEQVSSEDAMGTWNLLPAGGGENIESAAPIKTLSELPSGLYTLFVEGPSGSVTSIRVYDGTSLLQYVSVPQVSFNLPANGNFKVTVNFQFTKTGSVSITSDPQGIDFKVNGPNNIVLEGKTPMSYESQPEGQYKVQYFPPTGCGTPPAKGDLLKAANRISFFMEFRCDAADILRKRQESSGKSSDDYITATDGGMTVILGDVPKNAWFAPFVASVTRSGIMGGYRDAEGKLTGVFGPENSVTVAELAKIALNISGQPSLGHAPLNPAAQEGWFSGVIASAEDLGWTIYSDGTVDPVRPATRAEVLVTLLQAMNVPLHWQTGGVFVDVSVHTQFASAIETAAKQGLVSGRDDPNGAKVFGPTDPVNRAELSKILSAAAQKFRMASSSSSSSQR